MNLLRTADSFQKRYQIPHPSFLPHYPFRPRLHLMLSPPLLNSPNSSPSLSLSARFPAALHPPPDRSIRCLPRCRSPLLTPKRHGNRRPPRNLCSLILLCALIFCARSRAFRKPGTKENDLEGRNWQSVVKEKAAAAAGRGSSGVVVTRSGKRRWSFQVLATGTKAIEGAPIEMAKGMDTRRGANAGTGALATVGRARCPPGAARGVSLPSVSGRISPQSPRPSTGVHDPENTLGTATGPTRLESIMPPLVAPHRPSAAEVTSMVFAVCAYHARQSRKRGYAVLRRREYLTLIVPTPFPAISTNILKVSLFRSVPRAKTIARTDDPDIHYFCHIARSGSTRLGSREMPTTALERSIGARAE